MVFADLNVFKTSVGGNDIGLILDFANQFYNFGDNVNLGGASIIIASGEILGNEASNGYNGILIRPSDGQSLIGDWNYNLNNTHISIGVASQLIKTINQGNDIGLKLDFANSNYQLGQITGGNETKITIADTQKEIVSSYNGSPNGIFLDFNNREYIFGDINAINNGNYIKIIDQVSIIDITTGITIGNEINLLIDSVNNFLKTRFQSNDIGLKLDFVNQIYELGGTQSLNNTRITIDDINSTIKTFFGVDNCGLNLDLLNRVYILGQSVSGNITFLSIDDTNENLQTRSSTNNDGLNFDFANEIFKFGQIDSANGVHININGSAGIDVFQTIYSNVEQGLELQFNNLIYRFGHLTAGKQTQINIDDTLQSIILKSSYNIPGEEIQFLINGGVNGLIKTQYQQNDIGLKLDFANNKFWFGNTQTINTGTYLFIDTSAPEIFTTINSIGQGFYLTDLLYRFGDIQLTNNGTILEIDDTAAYPVQVSGTNVLSGTAGGSSGQHLKIKINGTDYKIKLENP